MRRAALFAMLLKQTTSRVEVEEMEWALSIWIAVDILMEGNGVESNNVLPMMPL